MNIHLLEPAPDIYGKQEIKMKINVSAQADQPLFVWPLLLLKSENQFFFYFIEELLVSQRRPIVLKRGAGSSSTQPYAYPYSNFLKCPLCCLLAQAIFTMSSVHIIDL